MIDQQGRPFTMFVKNQKEFQFLNNSEIPSEIKRQELEKFTKILVKMKEQFEKEKNAQIMKTTM